MDREFVEDATSNALNVALDLMESGAIAVVLTGSIARAVGNAESDLDLYAIGDGPHYRLMRRDGWLVSVSWRTVEALREAFRSPSLAANVVSGWRSAHILIDPGGVAAALKSEAKDWTWDVVGDAACEAWVTEELTGFAEEVHKLVHMQNQGNMTGAAIQRSLLALRLAPIIAVHDRMLYESENELWHLVSVAMGARWTLTQESALGMSGESLAKSCQASLELFSLACREIQPLFDHRQLPVVQYACHLAGFPLDM